jgi:hypothetical protein
VDSIGFRGYVSRAKALMENLTSLEQKIVKLSKRKSVHATEVLSESEIEIVVNKGYSWGKILRKVVTPKALLHDLDYIQSTIQETGD